MKPSFLQLLVIILCISTSTIPTSLVYNLRIAETSKQRVFGHNKKLELKNFIANGVLVEQFRKQYNGILDNLIGGIATLVFLKDTYYVRADFAAAQLHSQDFIPPCGPTAEKWFKQAQTDDLLFSAGYSKHISPSTKFTISGLLGIPTHKDTNLQHYSMGTGHYGIGLQIDGSILYTQSLQHSIITAARFVHFTNNKASLKIAGKTNTYDYDLGNLVDLFIAHHSNLGFHAFEFGYNPEFGFATSIKPFLACAVAHTEFMSSSFYGFYAYGFKLHNTLAAFSLGMSGGFNHTPKDVGYRYGVTLWQSFGVNF